MKVELNGLKELNRALNKAAKDIAKNVDFELKRIASEILQSALNKVPDSRGMLKSSAYINKIDNGWVIGFSAKYAPYVEFGTGPLVEIPVGYEDFAMEFFVNGSGHTPAQPFFLNTFIARKDTIVDELASKLELYLNSF